MTVAEVAESYRETLSGFCEALISSRSLYDYFHVVHAFVRYHSRRLPLAAVEQISDDELNVIFTVLLDFYNLANATRETLSARIGQATSFQRSLSSLPAGERAMPNSLLRHLKVLDDDTLKRLSATVQIISVGALCLRLFAGFKLTPSQSHSIIKLFAAPVALLWPQTLAFLPAAALDALLDDPGADSFTPSNDIVVSLAQGRRPIVIEMVAAESRMRSTILASIVKTMRTRRVDELAPAVPQNEEFLWFLRSRIHLPLPPSGFNRFDGSFNYESLLRETEKATVLRDEKGWAVFAHASVPDACFVVRYPASLDWFSAEKTIDRRREYDAHPLLFSRQFRNERHRSIMTTGIERQLAWLSEYAIQTIIDAALGSVSNALAALATRMGAGLFRAVPEATFTAAATYIAMVGMGMDEAAVVAVVEGVVHVFVKELYETRRDSDTSTHR